ncbi:uncharacterized protein BJ212DRAFT_1300422 [Suillus subaureus]|uniref:Uncharacterized protein n=1 Tax=Suillus subaureus TaxID=48587 RepID=A0A9P7E8N3_9AGAM|nr:uncharacterized protein BJ212DRAFT_1300422 [Suillus subaureus]KAG1814607.1 hypothetical protein BJ212DRAFT_1300422 [Suillus subaureus]
MKLLMMFLLLHTLIIIWAAPAGSNTARRASIAGSSVITTEGTCSDSSSTGSSCNFISSTLLESGCMASVAATATGSVTSLIMTAPTGTLVTAPTANDELSNTCTFRTFNIDETSLKVYMVGIILAASFAGVALTIVSVLTCSVGRCIKQYHTVRVQDSKNCGYSKKFSVFIE